MAHVFRSTRAQGDFDQIWDHISEGSVSAADRFLELIRTKCEMLAQHPLAGEARPELGANLRAFPVGNYIIFYRPDSDGIEVVRVLHGARDIPKQF